VEVYAITAQTQDLVDQLRRDLNLQFECFSDPVHILRNYLAEQDLIDIRISGVETPTEGKFYKVYSNYRNYSHGYAQPGVLCMTPDRTVQYSWAIEPSTMNLGGASDRPVPADIWSIVQLKMTGKASEQEIEQAYSRVRRRGNCSICTIL
jgi:hypothetical protein